MRGDPGTVNKVPGNVMSNKSLKLLTKLCHLKREAVGGAKTLNSPFGQLADELAHYILRQDRANPAVIRSCAWAVGAACQLNRAFRDSQVKTGLGI